MWTKTKTKTATFQDTAAYLQCLVPILGQWVGDNRLRVVTKSVDVDVDKVKKFIGLTNFLANQRLLNGIPDLLHCVPFDLCCSLFPLLHSILCLTPSVNTNFGASG